MLTYCQEFSIAIYILLQGYGFLWLVAIKNNEYL